MKYQALYAPEIKYDNFNMFTTANLTAQVKGQDASYYEVRYFIK